MQHKKRIAPVFSLELVASGQQILGNVGLPKFAVFVFKENHPRQLGPVLDRKQRHHGAIFKPFDVYFQEIHALVWIIGQEFSQTMYRDSDLSATLEVY